MKKLFLTLLLFCGTMLAFAEANWTDNFQLATELAQKEGKPILMLFTGSDWCGYCIKMEKNAFGVPAFGDFLNKNFVLFKADFPSRKQIPEDTKKQNRQLAKKYAIPGYPTVVIISANGKELTRTGFIRGGVKDYISHYQDILKKIK
ncbi:MAG: thioredoxin family protein [Victivallales bacterium]|nr:thioredoxin family protein [bacterium]MDD7750378.1 thioredoxin family protein [bacterium]MDY5697317.1 thioredoxin family protein [Victivallales bacterium]